LSTLSRVLNGRAAVTPEMAIRLSKAFGRRPEVWLKMQVAYDLAQAKRIAGKIKVDRYNGDDRSGRPS
jgi:addiction module HigA family antidote